MIIILMEVMHCSAKASLGGILKCGKKLSEDYTGFKVHFLLSSCSNGLSGYIYTLEVANLPLQPSG